MSTKFRAITVHDIPDTRQNALHKAIDLPLPSQSSAVCAGSLESVQFLVEHCGADVNRPIHSTCYVLCFAQKSEVREYLEQRMSPWLKDHHLTVLNNASALQAPNATREQMQILIS